MRPCVAVLLALLCAFSSPAQLPSFVPASGLRAWYPFTGNTNDSSGNLHHAVPYGGITFGIDRFGNPGHCIRGNALSATDIPAHNFPTGDSSRTVALYFKLTPPYPGGFRSLMSWGSNVAAGRFGLFTTDTSIGFEYGSGTYTTPWLPDTFWHSLTVTYPATGGGTTGISLYMDGAYISAPVITNPVSSFSTDTGTWHGIAGSAVYGSAFTDSWRGYIDDVAIWDRELTYCEVLQYAYNGLLHTAGTIAGPDSLCPGTSATLTTMGGTAGEWTSLNTTVASIGSSTGIITGLTPGTATIRYVTSSSCGADTAIYTITVLTPEICAATTPGQHTPSTGLNIYPNPTHGTFTINYSSPATEVVAITIGNTLGRQLLQLQIPSNTTLPVTIDVPPGIYFISADTKTARTISKLVIE